jgi:hypothetical protein
VLRAFYAEEHAAFARDAAAAQRYLSIGVAPHDSSLDPAALAALAATANVVFNSPDFYMLR